MNKHRRAYKSIGEVGKILGLNSKKRRSVPNHTIRFWEKEFKQIRPMIFNNNRRYYDLENIELLKKVQFLLKEQGMTINGVKKILNNKKTLKLDEISNHSIKATNLRNKLNKIRFELDKLDNSLIRIIKRRTNLVKKVLKLKEKKNQIVDQRRIKFILKNIKKKSLKNNIDPKITNRIWKNMIWSYIDFERRNFKK